MQLPALLDRLASGSSQSWPLADGIGPTPPVQTTLPCRSAQDADLWFAERTADVERAKAVCRQCPLRVECLEGALERGEPWGVWGGEVFVDGRVVAVKRGRGRPPKKVA